MFMLNSAPARPFCKRSALVNSPKNRPKNVLTNVSKNVARERARKSTRRRKTLAQAARMRFDFKQGARRATLPHPAP
ncbi:MAG: hypothetical protein M5U33_01355 [Pseudorhodoplanes sp.]|nr:hypothetical protein [Pseudorhodoplanes sp.]